jgi:L-lactate dehydrogenase complex protein LldG
MSSKADILSRVRRNLPLALPLPTLDAVWTTYADRAEQFSNVLVSVGGEVRVAAQEQDLRSAIQSLSCMADAKQIVSTIPSLQIGNFDSSEVARPHELADVDVAIVRGEFGVAENGAVWTSGKEVKHRALLFLTQHLVLVVPRDTLCHHMHEAYERLSFDGSGYGVFISGPSKTADIEQSLVIGAHGPRSLTVILAG